jgi:LysM repeat protein
MQRTSQFDSEPEPEGGLLDRVRAAASNLAGRLSGDRPQQALPLSRYRGQTGPVVPYEERRQQQRFRRRPHSSYALIFIVVLLILVMGIFYGLTWALGGLSFGGGARPTPTAAAQVAAPTASPSPPPPLAVLPTAAPGGTEPSPSPFAGTPVPGASPVVGPGGTEARTYVVRAGDTPGGIARQFGVSVQELMRANNITDARAMRVGDRLTIPPSATLTPVPTPRQ